MHIFRPSKTTKPVACRLPNEVHDIIDRRAKKQGIKIGKYIENRITTDALRKR